MIKAKEITHWLSLLHPETDVAIDEGVLICGEPEHRLEVGGLPQAKKHGTLTDLKRALGLEEKTLCDSCKEIVHYQCSLTPGCPCCDDTIANIIHME